MVTKNQPQDDEYHSSLISTDQIHKSPSFRVRSLLKCRHTSKNVQTEVHVKRLPQKNEAPAFRNALERGGRRGAKCQNRQETARREGSGARRGRASGGAGGAGARAAEGASRRAAAAEDEEGARLRHRPPGDRYTGDGDSFALHLHPTCTDDGVVNNFAKRGSVTIECYGKTSHDQQIRSCSAICDEVNTGSNFVA